MLGVGLTVTLGVTLTVILGDTLMLGVADGDTETEGLGVLLTVTDGVTLAPGVEVTLIEGVIVGVLDILTVTLGVILMLVVMVGVTEILGVKLGVKLGVTEGDPGISDLTTVYGSQMSSLTNFILEAENGISTITPETRSFTSTLDATKLVLS